METFGNLKIYLYIVKPDIEDDESEGIGKRVCVAQKYMLREDCESYVTKFIKVNKLPARHVYARWTVDDPVHFDFA